MLSAISASETKNKFFTDQDAAPHQFRSTKEGTFKRGEGLVCMAPRLFCATVDNGHPFRVNRDSAQDELFRKGRRESDLSLLCPKRSAG